jgi:hypothetical protein
MVGVAVAVVGAVGGLLWANARDRGTGEETVVLADYGLLEDSIESLSSSSDAILVVSSSGPVEGFAAIYPSPTDPKAGQRIEVARYMFQVVDVLKGDVVAGQEIVVLEPVADEAFGWDGGYSHHQPQEFRPDSEFIVYLRWHPGYDMVDGTDLSTPHYGWTGAIPGGVVDAGELQVFEVREAVSDRPRPAFNEVPLLPIAGTRVALDDARQAASTPRSDGPDLSDPETAFIVGRTQLLDELTGAPKLLLTEADVLARINALGLDPASLDNREHCDSVEGMVIAVGGFDGFDLGCE